MVEAIASRAAAATRPAPSGDLQDLYLNETQFAKLVARDLRTIRRWHQRRIGPPRIQFARGLVLYRKSAIVDWLASHEVGPRSERRKARQ